MQGCKKLKHLFYSNRLKQNKRGCFIRAEAPASGVLLGHSPKKSTSKV